jgi:hypothetical protein
MLASNPLTKMSFLNRVIGAQTARPFSVAFNVKSKFEAAFELKQKAAQGQQVKKG